jgi:CRISPR type III-A-associated RAMP protein Csm4
MQQALLVRLRPSGPWRYGPSDGALDRVDTLYRSDRLFSAITLAMRQLGSLDAWLDATARSEKPAVAFTSLFPFQGDTLYVTPPANLWPPPSSMVTSPSPVFLTKVRWRAAHFVPLSLVDSLLTGQSVLADQWIPDPESGCLLRRDRPSSSPFRTVARATAPVDRLRLTSTDAEPNACVEFEPGAGLWSVARFVDDAAHEAWSEPLKAAIRLLADTGFGGGRSKGWGQVQTPEFETGAWPALILPKVARVAKNDSHEEQTARSYWLMSLYSPSVNDSVNWSGGQYELTIRNGRVHGSSGALKKSVRMVVEGCILETTSEPVGAAVDVAPAGFAHPVYRSGIALSLLIPPIEARKAIEEIVPPELEATPFPFPPTEPTPATEIAAPEIAAPEIAEPEIAAPEIAAPEIAEPEIAEPEIAEPEIVEPEIVEPELTPEPIKEPQTTPEPPLTEQEPKPEPASGSEPPSQVLTAVASEAPVADPDPPPPPVHEPEPAPVPVTEPGPESTPSPEPEPDAPPVTEPENDSLKEPGYEV